jgi:NAD(P)-dependent dehydrogenase (short-subunit alcohol dehydrogenase family)
MERLSGRMAVITGGGSGIGRELARLLLKEGCSVAICDVSADSLAETMRLCQTDMPIQGLRISTHLADVADEAQVIRFSEEVAKQHGTEHINLLFNNAGITGGGSFVKGSREEWERTFNICWNGVYLTTRAFLPMLQRADDGHVVNLSSVAGFWAASGANMPHTAYSAAKFAVKGFSEGLIVDFRENAPHLKCSVVMPGHVGTAIVSNTRRVLRKEGVLDVDAKRANLAAHGHKTEAMTNAEVEAKSECLEEDYVKFAPVSAADAAVTILAGIRSNRWRILVGEDANLLDHHVRKDPERVYDADFVSRFIKEMKSPFRRLRRAWSRFKQGCVFPGYRPVSSRRAQQSHAVGVEAGAVLQREIR